MERNKGYVHGFTPEEQDRLRRQARIIEHRVNEHRLPFQRSRRLLEIGCGVGAQTEILLRHFPELHVTGLDASKTNLDKAREYLSGQPFAADRYEFVLGDAARLNFSTPVRIAWRASVSNFNCLAAIVYLLLKCCLGLV